LGASYFAIGGAERVQIVLYNLFTLKGYKMKNTHLFASLILVLIFITPNTYGNDQPTLSIKDVAPQVNDFLFGEIEKVYKTLVPKTPKAFWIQFRKDNELKFDSSFSIG
jgi:hypothetical protein